MLETTNYNQYKKIFLFLIISFVSAQKLRTQTFSYANDSVIYIFYGKTEKSITLEARTKREYKQSFKTDIKFPEIEGKRVEFEEAICMNGKIFLFTSLHNKKSNIYTAYANEISLDGKLNPQCITVDEILNSEKDNKGYFTISLSTDSNNILVFHAHDETIQGEMRGKICYKTLDKNLKATSTNEIEMPTSFDYCSALKRQLIDAQNLFYLEKNYTKVKGEKDRIITYNACLYNAKEKKLYKTEIMPNEKYILDINIEISKQGQLFISGIYGIDKSFGGSWDGIRCLKGSYYSLLDKNNLSVISHNTKNIQEALANDKLYRFHHTNSYLIDNTRVEVICQFQHKLLVSGVGDDAIYKEIYGQFISTSFNLNDKSDVLLKVTEK
jgi:hypothetical protein